MHKLDPEIVKSLETLPSHAQKIINDIYAYLLRHDNVSHDEIVHKCQKFSTIVVTHYEDIMPEIEMLHNRIFENQWEDDNPHFAEHILEIMEDIIEDYSV